MVTTEDPITSLLVVYCSLLICDSSCPSKRLETMLRMARSNRLGMNMLGFLRAPRAMTKVGTKRFSTTAAVPHSAGPPQEHKAIAYWLLGMGGLVAGMVTIGGITRLTRSGLSMTDWRLQGSMPPMNRAEWEKEFERYKTFPEWKQRQSMTLEEFKFIYFWEYSHRMFGRFLGIAFTAPMVYFAARGMIPRTLYPRLGLLFGLGGAQGLIGWWMVKSGLDNVDPNQRKEIRVSPYRLATHLTMAFTTYGVLIWTGLDLLNTPERARQAASQLTSATLRHCRNVRWWAVGNGLLVATTVVSGAFVAGNDAGRAFNTYPMMGDVWIPDEILEMQPVWRNFFENTATVQFDHRMLAVTTLGSIWSSYAYARSGGHWTAVPRSARVALTAVTHMSALQVGLGIATLLMYVPVPLAAVHQLGSLVLLTLVIGSTHSLNFARQAASLPAAAMVAAAAGTVARSAAGTAAGAGTTAGTAAGAGAGVVAGAGASGVTSRAFSTSARPLTRWHRPFTPPSVDFKSLHTTALSPHRTPTTTVVK